mgnify:CR=1 FL=1
MLGRSVKDLVVYSKDMVNLGKVKDFEFEPGDMKITSIIVKFEKEAAKDLIGKMIVIRHADGKVPTPLVESIRDGLILKHSYQELKGTIESV